MSDKKHMDRTIQLDKSAIEKELCRANKGNKTASFIILGGLDIGSIVHIKKPIFTIGRDPSCDLILRDDGISRIHAEVTCLGDDTIAIKDLGSTNGTFIGGRRISESILKDGEKVLLGRRTIVKFALQDELEQSYQRKIYESSTRDGLTGVFNRKYFIQKLNVDISFARRHQLPFSLLLLDIDFFKKINDTYGHQTGDEVLVRVTETIGSTIRTEDCLARYGGEEFVVIAQGTDLEGGTALGERIRAAVGNQTIEAADKSGRVIRVTVSIGVATALQLGSAARGESIIAHADKNLYLAKETGRNKTVSSEMK